MRIGLFIPCYIDQFYPHVGVATLELLERLGLEVYYSPEATCCGQPMANAGHEAAGLSAMRHLVDAYRDCGHIVVPSGSCVLHIRDHYGPLGPDEAVRHVRQNTYELCEFLVDVLGVDRLGARFPHRVGLHSSCHGLRGLRLEQDTELIAPPFSKVRRLLDAVDGLQLVELDRPDECCGFGGTFAVSEAALSVKMGRDRLADHRRHDAEVITATDMSCLMHLEGIIRRQKLPLKAMHVAEILNSRGNGIPE